MRLVELLNGDFLSLSLVNEWHLTASEFTLNNGTKVSIWDTGVIIFSPQTYSERDIILSCGIHGNETAPIELLSDLVQTLLLEKWQVNQRVMFIFGNPAAINANVREVRDNLNRLFSGAHLGGRSRERDRAAKLEAYVDRFFREGGATRARYHYDLHTALRSSLYEKFAIYPYLHDSAHNLEQLAFLSACGISAVVLMNAPSTTFSYFSSKEFSAHAFTLELGKAAPFGQNAPHALTLLRTQLINFCGQIDYVWPQSVAEVNVFAVYREIRRNSDDFRFLFLDDLPNFAFFQNGDRFAVDGDINYCIEQPQETIIFPNLNVAIGQRVCLTAIPISIPLLLQNNLKS
ncbi:MAG: succinylglutamate desuccinylase [Plesiomonas sp.]|uniref:succinylglutamate desuccinylase n=1 Tax=Plesiomonas sp. TaxID=2486279 RepID=UPI003F31AD14